MGLYDQYKQANSQAVSQFVGSIVPEVAQATKEAQERYNQSMDMDDKLTEAMNNLQHLKTEEDTQYATELKERYYGRLQERSGRADYENLGRRTRRDAMQFSQEYMPLVQRQQAMSELVKNIQEDKDIIDPATKTKLVEWQQKMNSPKKDASGDYVRDASGRIVLGKIQALPYAKDVNVIEKLDKFLSSVEAKVAQSPYRTEGGLLISDKSEVRDPKILAQLASEFMKADPEVRAMLDRDVTLNTFKLTSEDYRKFGKENNKSLYQQMVAANMTPAQIEAQAKLRGVKVDDLKVSELDKLLQTAKATGVSEDQAYAAYYKKHLYNQIASPAVSLVAEKLRIDKHTLDVRNDPDYEAKARARAQKDMDSAADIILTESAYEDVQANRNPERSKQNLVNLKANRDTTLAYINASMAEALGIQPLSNGFTKEQRDQFTALAKDKGKAKEMVQTLMEKGQRAKAIQLEENVRRYNETLTEIELEEDRMNNVKYDPDNKSRGTGYTIVTDTSPSGKVGAYVKKFEEQAQSGALNGIDIKTGKRFGVLLEELHGNTEERLKAIKDRKAGNLKVDLTTSSYDGKPVALVTMPDGKRRAIALEGINPAAMTETFVQSIKDTYNRGSSELRDYQLNTFKVALGELAVRRVTRSELEQWAPTSKPHPLGDGFSVRIGMDRGVKTYRLMYNGDLKSAKVFKDPAGVFAAIGEVKLHENTQ